MKQNRRNLNSYFELLNSCFFYLFARYSCGFTGLPYLRISKWSLVRFVPVSPISAIFWPFFTHVPSLTSILLLWAYALRYFSLCFMMIRLPNPLRPLPL